MIQPNVRTVEAAVKVPDCYRNIILLFWSHATKHSLEECATVAKRNYSAGYRFVEVVIIPDKGAARLSIDG